MGGCMQEIARFVLVVVNIIFMIIGFALSVCGFILRFGKSLYEPFIDVGKNQLKTVFDDTGLANFDVDSIDIGEMVHSLSIGLIIGGLVLMGLAFFGCCGACCKIQCLLWLYLIVIVVFVIGEAVAIGLLYGKPEIIKDQLKTTLKDDYEGLASSSTMSFAWNIIMIQFKCCGVDSYKDFSESTKWKKTITVGSTPVNLVTPVACCKTLPSGKATTDFDCAAKAYDETLSNGETGCFNTLWDLSLGNNAIAIPVLVVCGIIELLFILLAYFIIKEEKNKVSPI